MVRDQTNYIYFRNMGIVKQIWGTSLLPQAVLIFSIKPISSSISLDGQSGITAEPTKINNDKKCVLHTAYYF